ncbi:transcriptional regulator TACO1-like protein [Syncephalis fuscata]|nr:transcriptional regulator TACO1-like protein [Syncephalis fuscata]
MLRNAITRSCAYSARQSTVFQTSILPAIFTEQRRHAGHSKWAKIKRTKGAADMKRGLVFSKISLEIVSAIRHQGPDSSLNLRLAAALNKARAHSLPKENIDKAFKKATSKAQGGADVEDVAYEAFGTHGVALIIEAVTDNRTRTIMKIRSTLTKFNGQLTPVAYLFERKGVVQFSPASSSVDAHVAENDESNGLDDSELDQAMEAAIEAGAEDVDEVSPGLLEGVCAVSELQAVSRALANLPAYQIEAVELRYQAETPIDEPQDPEAREALGRMLEDLDSIEDVVRLYTNLPTNSSLLP